MSVWHNDTSTLHICGMIGNEPSQTPAHIGLRDLQ